MIDRPPQERPGVRSDPRIGLPQLERALERGLKQPAAGAAGLYVAFTPEGLLPFRGACVSSRPFYAAQRTGFERKLMKRVNNPG